MTYNAIKTDIDRAINKLQALYIPPVSLNNISVQADSADAVINLTQQVHEICGDLLCELAMTAAGYGNTSCSKHDCELIRSNDNLDDVLFAVREGAEELRQAWREEFA